MFDHFVGRIGVFAYGWLFKYLNMIVNTNVSSWILSVTLLKNIPILIDRSHMTDSIT